MKLFKVKDKNGREIYLTTETWYHVVSEHPNLADKYEDIKITITNPLIIKESIHDPEVKYYYTYSKKRTEKLKPVEISLPLLQELVA